VIDVAYVVLAGTGGWNQRWEIAAGQEEAVAAELDAVGTDRVGHLRVLDPLTDKEVILVVAWRSVATGVVVPEESPPPSQGQYA
jgi:hypothetical protein